MQNNTPVKAIIPNLMNAIRFYLFAGLLGISMISCQPAREKAKSNGKEGVSETSE